MATNAPLSSSVSNATALVEHAAERPDVGPAIHRLAARLLGAHVGRRAEDRAGVGRMHAQRRRHRQRRGLRIALEHLGEAEVEHLHLAVGRDLDVCRLQISVDDTFVMSGLQRIGDLPRHIECLAYGESGGCPRAMPQALLECLAFNQLENDADGTVDPFETVDRRDVRMIERGEELRFALEACDAIRILRKRIWQTLIATSRFKRVSLAR